MFLFDRLNVQLQLNVFVRRMDEELQHVVATQLRKRLFDMTYTGPFAAHVGVVKCRKNECTSQDLLLLNRP